MNDYSYLKGDLNSLATRIFESLAMSSKPIATPRKIPKQDRSQATVEAILIATAHILTEFGYDQFNTNRVAERAGVSIGSLYQYFPNKQALLFALAENHAQEMVAMVQQHLIGLEDCSILEVMQHIIKAALVAHAINPSLHRILNEQIPRSAAMRQTAEAKMEQLLRSFLAQRCHQIQPQNLDLTVFIVGRTIEALTHGAVLDRPELLANRELAQEITTLISMYLVGEKNSRLIHQPKIAI
jgi:AcrR family transcriptional regulator